MMACYMYITIKYMKLKTSVVYVHSVALKVKFEERKGKETRVSKINVLKQSSDSTKVGA